jgi:hypothetical protein
VPVGVEGVILVEGPALSCGYKGVVENGNTDPTVTVDADADVNAGTIAAEAVNLPRVSAASSPAGQSFITLQSLNPCSSSSSSSRFFNTNDLGHLDAAGVLHFHGRVDGQCLKSRIPFLPRIRSRTLMGSFH